MIRSVSYYWYRMGNQRMVWSLVVTLTISIQSSHVFAENHCASPQHGYLGKEGIISCNIDQGIDKVYWFNETDGYDYSFIRMEDGHISGSGYKSNEYKISQNGSLVIRNVQCKHQQSYQVTFQISVNESEVNLRVNFIVIDTDNSCNVTTEPQFTTSYTTETTKPGPTTSNSGSTLPSEVTSIVQSTKVVAETDNSRSETTEPQFTTTYTTETTKPEDSNIGYTYWIWIVVVFVAIIAVVAVAVVVVLVVNKKRARRSTNQEGNGNNEGDGETFPMTGTSQHDDNADTGF